MLLSEIITNIPDISAISTTKDNHRSDVNVSDTNPDFLLQENRGASRFVLRM